MFEVAGKRVAVVRPRVRARVRRLASILEGLCCEDFVCLFVCLIELRVWRVSMRIDLQDCHWEWIFVSFIHSCCLWIMYAAEHGLVSCK